MPPRAGRSSRRSPRTTRADSGGSPAPSSRGSGGCCSTKASSTARSRCTSVRSKAPVAWATHPARCSHSPAPRFSTGPTGATTRRPPPPARRWTSTGPGMHADSVTASTPSETSRSPPPRAAWCSPRSRQNGTNRNTLPSCSAGRSDFALTPPPRSHPSSPPMSTRHDSPRSRRSAPCGSQSCSMRPGSATRARPASEPGRSAPARRLFSALLESAAIPQHRGPDLQESLVSKFLFHLGRSSARHPFRVLGLWLVAAIAIVSLQGSVGGQFDNSFRVPGVESQHAADVLNARFPTHGGQSARLVLHTNTGRLDDAGHAPTVTHVRKQLAHGHQVAGVTDPLADHTGAVSADGKTAYLDVAYRVDKLTATQYDDA